MANYELLGLNKTTPQIVAPTSADKGYVVNGLMSYTDKDVLPNIPTIAILRAFTGTPPTVYLACHTTAGDGGHGEFRYVSGAAPGTYVDNNGTIIVPTGGDGSAAWIRDYSGAVDVLWWAGLAYDTTATDPGDPNSYLLASFKCWDAVIQAALDYVFSIGGGKVILSKNSVPYYVRDSLLVKSNTTFEFYDWIVLADYNLVGGVLSTSGDNITVINPQIDASGIFAGGSGYNGLGFSGSNIRAIGGKIKNCARGFGGPADGGKGIQVEPGAARGIRVSSVAFENCFMAMSTIRDYLDADPYEGIVYSDIVAHDCEILFFVQQSNGSQNQTGTEHSVQLTNFYARNCGTFEGVIQLSRAANVKLIGGVVVNESGSDSPCLIRGNHASCTFSNIDYYSAAGSVINLDPSTYAADSSQQIQNNHYDIRVLGSVNQLVDVTVSTAFRTLNDCTGEFKCLSEPAVGWFDNELRNGASVFQLSHNQKVFTAATNLNHISNGTGKPANFSDLPSLRSLANYHAVGFANFDIADPLVLDWYQEDDFNPTFTSDAFTNDATYTSTGRFTRIGRTVTIHGVIALSSLGTESGRILVGGIPFSNVASPAKLGSAIISELTLANALSLACAIGSASNDYLSFPWMSNVGGGGDSIRITNITATSVITFTLTYTI